MGAHRFQIRYELGRRLDVRNYYVANRSISISEVMARIDGIDAKSLASLLLGESSNRVG